MKEWLLINKNKELCDLYFETYSTCLYRYRIELGRVGVLWRFYYIDEYVDFIINEQRTIVSKTESNVEDNYEFICKYPEWHTINDEMFDLLNAQLIE